MQYLSIIACQHGSCAPIPAPGDSSWLSTAIHASREQSLAEDWGSSGSWERKSTARKWPRTRPRAGAWLETCILSECTLLFSAARQRCEIHHMPGTISTSRSRQIRPRHEHISSSEEPRIQPLRTLTTKTIWTGDFRKAKSRCRTAYTLDCVLHFVEARSELVCSFDQRSLRITTLSYVRQFASENKHDAGAESYTGGD